MEGAGRRGRERRCTHPSGSPYSGCARWRPAPRAPVFLLHGAGDNVIPMIETDRLAASLAGWTEVRALVTPLLMHADVAPEIQLRDAWRVVAFWKDVLDRR